MANENPDNVNEDKDIDLQIPGNSGDLTDSEKQEEQENLNGLEMANPQVVNIKDALKIVPEFDGKNILLSQFLEGFTEALAMVEAAAEPSLTKLIRSRIFGEGRQAITGQDFANIEALKDYLKQIYAPAKLVVQLLGEVGNEFQQDFESVLTFANRIRILGERILEAKKIEQH